MSRQWTRIGVGFAAGTVAVILLTWLRLALAPALGTDMALTFYVLAVLLAALLGGTVPGIATMLLSLLAGIVLVIGPAEFLELPAEWIRAALFVLEGVAISLVIDLLQVRTAALQEALDDLAGERLVVERMALEDAMTGLGNWRAFEKDLDQAIARSSRDASPLTIVSADVDELKRTNDEYGHAAGDALIIMVAEALSETCRASDGAYRLGGDEFAVLLPGAEAADFDTFSRRLAERLDQAPSPLTPKLSVGASHMPLDGVCGDELRRIADERMYSNKGDGRSLPNGFAANV